MERTTVTLTSFVRSCRILFLLPHIILLMRFFPVAWEPRSDKNVSYESATLRTQVFGYRLCASRLAANLVLPAHAVPSIRELYHRKWVITLLAALGPGSSFSLKKHRLLAGGWTTCKVGTYSVNTFTSSLGSFTAFNSARVACFSRSRSFASPLCFGHSFSRYLFVPAAFQTV